MKIEGKIKSTYLPLKKNGDLAELIGVVLGDGHICVYPRTEELRVISNSNNPGFIKRYARIMQDVFDKQPYVVPNPKQNSTKIGFYQKFISKRLGVPTGARKHAVIKVPSWILRKKEYIVRYLRGLYEAEGSIHFHKKTYTHKFIFTNYNTSMLDNVCNLVLRLGIQPHRSVHKIQVSKKKDVEILSEMLEFRKY